MIDFLIQHKDLFLILAGFGTFISALIAVFTLIEVKKQRLSMYKPDILIKSFIVTISKNPLQKEEELLEYKVQNYNDYSINYNETKFENSPKYKVENFGFGVAKNVECQWYFDTKKAIKLIQEILPNSFSFSYHESLNLYFLNNLQNDNFHHSANANIECQNIDYIAPFNVQTHYQYHIIPQIIVYVHYLFLIFKKKLIEQSVENFHIFEFDDCKFPKPTLSVKYKDLNDKIYQKTYKFKISAVATQGGSETLDMTEEFSYLTFELE
jgi:hypothetical protein